MQNRSSRAVAPPPQRRPKGPGRLYSALSLVLVVVLGALTMTATQPPPPTIAEFAPQAVEQIEDAPDEQTSQFGEGSGPGTDDAAATPPPPGAVEEVLDEAIEVPRVRRCIGDPPRQTEDPQSPPCVPYWAGDNGGATSKGVTPNEIRLVQSGGAGAETARIYQTYFNRRFEFYGRRVTVHLVEIGGNTCEEQTAAATEIDEQVRAFAVIDSASAATACFHEELARRGVISGVTNALFSEAEMAALHPYMWQYVMGHEKLFGAVGEMACNRLAGHNAAHAGDPLYRQSQRKFGIILHEEERHRPIELGPLERALAACGESSAVTFVSSNEIIEGGADETVDSQNAVLQMKSEGVTTVICMCTIFKEQYLSVAATNQGYFPEWIVSTYFANDVNTLIRLFWGPEHRRNMLGLTAQPPMRDGPDEPAYYTAREADPNTDPKTLPQLFNAYRTMLLMASGLQMAGPNLTPRSFGTGLNRTPFPNPPDPTRSGAVGFLDGGHGMTNDLAEFWWSETTRGPDVHPSWSSGEPGAMCFVDGGQRRLPGSWPTEPDPFFQPPCYPRPH